MKKLLYNNKKIWIAILLIIATGLCFIKFLRLEEGGAMTFFSMGILWLITYFFGFKDGFIACLIFSILKFAVTYITGEPINYNPACIILEYPVAFMGFSLGALLPQNKKTAKYIRDCKRQRTESQIKIDNPDETDYYDGSINNELLKTRQGDEDLENSHSGLILGYLVGLFHILIIYILCAELFYDKQANMNSIQNAIYSILYDSSYLFFEGFFTVLIFMIPGVYDSIKYMKHVANNPQDNPSIYGF